LNNASAAIMIDEATIGAKSREWRQTPFWAAGRFDRRKVAIDWMGRKRLGVLLA
jgi:hypothetical protein